MKLTRRTVLGSIAGTLATPSIVLSDEEPSLIKLRLLETSDLHMFVLDWDYYRAKRDPTVGVSRVSTLIKAARAEVANSLLFDNGDFLQGTPLADYVAMQPLPVPGRPHPLVAIMSSLGYDAVGLGNHEFNFGLEFLEASLTGAGFPFVCANVTRADGSAFLPPYVILDRTFLDQHGKPHSLKIGVIGFVPPQITMWDQARLAGKLKSADIVLTAKRYVPELREKCDLVIALSHSGIKAGDWVEGEENSSLFLAGVGGIDAIFTGHSHRVFPGPSYEGLPGVDALAGRLNGVPAVMPGFWGSHLGLIDLEVVREDGRWQAASSRCEARPIYRRQKDKVEELAEADAAVAAQIKPAHEETLKWVEQPVGALSDRLNSYFVWIGLDPATNLVNEAQVWYAKPLLANTPYAALPVLSTAAPYRVGYTPDSFIDIPNGSVSLRQVADLYVYSSNTVVALKVTGAQVLDWLEYASRVFLTINPSAAGPQPLVDRKLPSYVFDVFKGLSYKIDVTVPSRFDAKGAAVHEARRVMDVLHNGQPLDPKQDYIVITNNYRADGRGTIPSLGAAEIVLRAPDTNREAILRYFKAHTPVSIDPASPWSFAPLQGAAVYFDTSDLAKQLVPSIPGLADLGTGEPGYLRVAIHLP